MTQATPLGIQEENNLTHMWNDYPSIHDYYMEKDCLQELSNQNNTRWETIKYSVGWLGENEPTTITLPFTQCTKTYSGNNQTIVQAQATTTLTQGQYTLTYGIRQELTNNSPHMNQTHYLKLNKNYPANVWFIANTTNINIGNTTTHDYLNLQHKNGQIYYLNLTKIREQNLTYTLDQTQIQPYYIISDLQLNEHLKRDWSNNNYNYKLIINKNKIQLLIKIGTFTKNQIKTINIQWADATCTCTGAGTMTATSNYINTTNITEGDQWQFGCKLQYNGFGICSTGCTMEYKHNQYKAYGQLIPKTPNATDVLDCDVSTTYCTKKATLYNTFYYIPVNCNKTGYVGTWCTSEVLPRGWTVIPSTPIKYINCSAIPIPPIEPEESILPELLILAAITVVAVGVKNGNS